MPQVAHSCSSASTEVLTTGKVIAKFLREEQNARTVFKAFAHATLLCHSSTMCRRLTLNTCKNRRSSTTPSDVIRREAHLEQLESDAMS